MSNVTIQARISKELKEDANVLFAEMGLSVSDAIRMFLQQSVNRGGLPFKPIGRKANALTAQAIEEIVAGQSKTFHSVEDLFDELEN